MSTVPRQMSGVRRRPLTKAEYYQLGEAGFFRGQKVELIGGQIVLHDRQSPLHYTCIIRTVRALEAAFGAGHHARPQGPIDLGPTSEPEPDVSIVTGTLE